MRRGSSGFLLAAFDRIFVRKKRPAAENRRELLELALRGGFPALRLLYFVFNELAAQVDAEESERYQLFHYRDQKKREIDFLIEREDGALLGIEVKASSMVKGDNFKHLRWFQENLAQQKKFTGIVLYAGEDILPFGSGTWAVPISTLWAES